MGKVFEAIKNAELSIPDDEFIQISFGEYSDASERLSSISFARDYSKVLNGNEYAYFKRTSVDSGITEDEVDAYLLYEILKSQRNSEKSINVIKGVVVFFLIISIIGIIIAIAGLANLSRMLS